MDKRRFLLATALSFPAMRASAAETTAHAHPFGPPLLTVTGAIGRANRGPLDPALDQLMRKHNLQFSRAFTFDFFGLTELPAVSIRPTLEYDGKPHRLRGPLMTDVLKAVGASATGPAILSMRAIDGYAVSWTYADILKYQVIVATHVDDNPIPIGGLGPLWAVYEADRYPEMARKTLAERFAGCPWGLYHIEIQQA